MKAPDLNAPRFRRNVSIANSIEFAEDFLKKNPQYENFTPKQIKTIINAFNQDLWESVIEYRDGVEIPCQLGHLFIGSCPAAKKRKNTNMKASIEYKKQLKHRNFESDQYIAKIFYTTFNSKYKFKHHELWAFDSARVFSRSVSASYPENWKKYVQIDPYMKVSSVYKSNSYAMERLDISKEVLDEYDEFNF